MIALTVSARVAMKGQASICLCFVPPESILLSSLMMVPNVPAVLGQVCNRYLNPTVFRVTAAIGKAAHVMMARLLVEARFSARIDFILSACDFL